MPRTPQSLPLPFVLTAVGGAGDAVFSAWRMRRKPQSSGKVLRRALALTTLTQGLGVAQQALAPVAVAESVLQPSASGFAAPEGEPPVRVSASWEADPGVVSVQGETVVVAGPGFDDLDGAAQQAAYDRALARHVDPATAAGLALGQGLVRFGVHRALIGSRTAVSRRRTAAVAAALVVGEMGLQAAAYQVSRRRRRARVARDQARLPLR